MLSSFKGLSWIDRSNNHQPSIQSPTKQKAESSPIGLHSLASDGPPRPDGSDKYFGMENVVGFGNTCYCNSILQCLYYSKPFRENVVNFPQRSGLSSSSNSDAALLPGPDGRNLSRVSTDPLPGSSGPPGPVARKPSFTPAIKEETKKPRIPVTASLTQGPTFGSNENKDTPEVKKKLALATGPVLNVDQGNHASYGMEESLFSALKDIFESIVAHNSHTGVVSPNRFLDILRRENDMFSGQQHQDAHEFLNYVLNQVIENVEDYQKKHGYKNGNAVTNSTPAKSSGTLTPVNASSAASTVSLTSTSSTGWIHELFEGLLTSETKCLTCENVSRRDEQFLDLSIDLEKNSSVTSCLRNFSASEMLCERNKFHCDSCGGLQEAEKRMKIKRLPKVLALHLKRFKFMENLGRFEKLHYRVLYPYHLRLFNTTDDAEDPDRLYELYAVVVHIGGGPYHGHYVAIVKTEDKGWLLFDDELVEPVDKAFVRNFFGERPGMACAYVLFYQETTFEAVQREMWADEQAAGVATRAAAEAAKTESAKSKGHTNGTNGHGVRTSSMAEHLPNLHPSSSSPLPKSETPTNVTDQHPAEAAAKHPFPPVPSAAKSKKEREKERKAEKGDKKDNHMSSINRFRNTSRSLRQAPKWLGGKDKERNSTHEENGSIPDLPPLPVTPGLPLGDDQKEAPNGVNHESGADDGKSGDDFSPKTEVPPVAESPKVTVHAVVPAVVEESPAVLKEEVVVPQEPERDDKGENSKKEKKEKKEKREKKEKEKEKTRHRSSFFGLRKKASIAFHSES